MFKSKVISYLVFSTLFYSSCESSVHKSKLLDEKYKEIIKQESLLENGNHEISRVVGPRASIKDYPYITSITEATSFWGTGAILNKLWVVTSAFAIMGDKPEQVFVRYGTELAIDKGQTSWASKLFLHPNHTQPYANDIGLIKLKKPIKFSKTVKAIKLPSKSPTNGDKVSMGGFGYYEKNEKPTHNTEKLSDYAVDGWLRSASLEVLTHENCKPYYSSESTFIKSSFCTTLSLGSGPCQHDYGNPLVKEKEIIGVLAYVTQCQSTMFPPVYTDIYAHKEWIEKTIKDNSDRKELEDLNTDIKYF